MRDITNQQVLDSVNATIQGLIDVMVTKDDLRKALSNYATKEEVREIVREEMADIRDEQLRHGTILDEHTGLFKEHGVLIEQMDNKVSALAELVDENLTMNRQVKDHDKRMDTVESRQKLVISTVRLHSAQIKELQAGQK
jgi:phage host-nuclease inhibitor protein Gam